MDTTKFCESAEIWKGRYFQSTLEENKKIFNDYLELCIKHNTIPIVTVFPVTKIYREFFPKRVYDEFLYIINEAQKKYSFQFINAFNADELVDINDFSDSDHLNDNGAVKI